MIVEKKQDASPAADLRSGRLKDTDGSVRPLEDTGYRFVKTPQKPLAPKQGRDGA